MTLEKEIESWQKDIIRLRHCKDKALPQNKERYEDCIDYDNQYIDWLKELMAYRIAYERIKGLPLVWEKGAEVSNCIHVIEEELESCNSIPEMKCEED